MYYPKWAGQKIEYAEAQINAYLMAIEKEEPTVLANTGYSNGIETKNCINYKIKVYIKKVRANNSTKNNKFQKEKFTYNKEQDIYICPSGNSLFFFESTSKNGIKYRRYKCYRWRI